MTFSGPVDNLKMVLWGILGLLIAFLVLGPGVAGALNGAPDQSLEIINVSRAPGGEMTIRYKVLSDFIVCYDYYDDSGWSVDHYYGMRVDGENSEDWVWNSGYDDGTIAWPPDVMDKHPDDEDWSSHWCDGICVEKKAGSFYDGYLYFPDDMPGLNEDWETWKDNAIKKEDPITEDVDEESLLTVKRNYGPAYDDYYNSTGTFYVAPKIANVNWIPDGGTANEFPIEFEIHYENLATTSSNCWLRIANDYYNAGPLNYYKGNATSGTTTITVPRYDTTELGVGPYDQNEFFCCDDATGECSKNLISEYSFEVGSSVDPTSVNLPLPEWEEVSTTTAEDFYSEYSDYATPTPAFGVIFESIEPFYQWIHNISEMFSRLFNTNKALDRGKQVGNAIAQGRAFASSLDSFLGGLPVSWILLIYVLVAGAVIVFRLIRGLLNVVKP